MATTRAIALSVVSVLGVSAASAADLPVVVEPVDYVRICDAFGTGFYYIPGTETCLAVAGRVRADYNVFINTDNDDFDVFDGLGYDGDGDDGYRFRARAYIYLDSRTNTEFGLLRTFTEVYFTSDFGAGDASEGLETTLDRAFIQFGGLTFGRTQSFYDFTDAIFTPAQFWTPSTSDVVTNVAAYTFAVGNGVSLTLSAEDEISRRTGIVDGEYQGSRIPDIVGNARIEQGWGAAQVMAAGHYTEDLVSNEEAYGFAVGGGVVVNLPFGNETSAGLTATYSHGAVSYASSDVSAPFEIGDAVVGPGGDLELTDAFAVTGGFATSITPSVSFAAQAGYALLENDQEADLDGDGVLDDTGVQNVDVQGFLAYAPVEGMEFGLGVEYRYVDTEDFGSGSALTSFLRAQRTF
jgi:hypothetical protein